MKWVLFIRRTLKWLLLCFLAYLFLFGVLTPIFQPAASRSFSLPDVTSDAERICCVDDNEEALSWRLRLIDLAQEEIVLSTFDFGDDESGRDIMAALLDAAERGVQVRILVDGIKGALNLTDSACFRALANTSGVEVRYYNPVNLLKPWEWNYRMHDKYLLIDDAAYILGGRNTNDLFLGTQESYNIDRDLVIYEPAGETGTSMAQVRTYFEAVWNQACCKTVSPAQSDSDRQAAIAELEQRMEQLRRDRPDDFQSIDWEAETLPTNRITLLTNATTVQKKSPELWEDLQALMAQGEDCVLITPYIICDREMYEGLTTLTENSHLDLVTNAVENGANPWGCTDLLNNRDNILSTGVGLCEVLPGQSLHTKTILVDDWLSIVGSYNLDVRSTRLDTEMMLAVDSPELNAQLRERTNALTEWGIYTSAEGETTEGAAYEPVTLEPSTQIVYTILRVLIRPFRHLL